MKLKPLLLPLLLGSGLVMAQDVNLSHPGQINQDLQQQHLQQRLALQQAHAATPTAQPATQAAPQTSQRAPQQPRLMSPAEFEKVQAQIYAEHQGVTLSAKWQTAAQQAYLTADSKSPFRA